MRTDLQDLRRRLTGRWTSVATHPALPGELLPGTLEVEALGPFLVQRVAYEHPEFPDALWVIGEQVDYFDVRGVHRVFDLTVEPEGFSIVRPKVDGDFGQRMVFRLSGDDRTLRGSSQLSHDGRTWVDDLAMTGTRSTG